MKKIENLYVVLVMVYIVIVLCSVPNEKEREQHKPINVKLK